MVDIIKQLKGVAQSTYSTDNISEAYAEQERQLSLEETETEVEDFANFYITNSSNPPAYSLQFGPFYTGVSEIGMFASSISSLSTAASDVVTKATDVSNAVNDMNSWAIGKGFSLSIPNVPSFDITSIIGDINFSFSLTSANSGRCGLNMNFPTTLMGAANSVVQQMQKSILTQVLNFLDKIDYMFSVPTRMLNNILSYITQTKTNIKAPLADYRTSLMNDIKKARMECILSNNPALKVTSLVPKLNTVAELDGKIRDLITKLLALESAVKKFLIQLENCYKMGIYLSRTLQAVISGWQKDSTCIQAKFTSLIKAVI